MYARRRSSNPDAVRDHAANLVSTCYDLGYTPMTLSRATGLSRTTLWRLERRLLNPRRVTVKVLALAAKVLEFSE